MFGDLITSGGRTQLRFVRNLPHAPEKVWEVLTEPEHLEAWFPTTIEGERAEGARLRFAFPGGGDSMDGEMITFDPPRLMEFVWGDDVLRFEIEPDGEGTVLTLVHSFDEYGRAARDAAGWHEKLVHLAAHLGEDPSLLEGQEWGDVHPGYVDRFGPEASTVGPPGGG